MNQAIRGALGRVRASAPVVVFLFLIPVAALFASMLLNNGGELVYTLDDPYIHIKLAKNIFAGHYGINADEYSAPSSSILWPFLLAPFAALGDAAVEYAPLLLNLAFAFGTLLILDDLLRDVGHRFRIVILGGCLLATNFYGLIFSGMEHSLQILLVALIARGVIGREFQGRATTFSLYLALLVLPLVRYEGLAVSVPTLIYLVLKGEGAKPVVVGALLALAVALFSLFLRHLGLGYLPSSVLLKLDTHGVSSVVLNAVEQFKKYGWLVLAVLLLCAYLHRRRALALLLLCATFLHLFFGRMGGRYEIYWLTFVGLFFVYVAVSRLDGRRAAMAFGLLPVAFAGLVYATLSTPFASAAIHNQQYSTADIVRRLDEPVAVNDLGLVSLRSERYVLDLWGLGSLEALRLRQSGAGADWIGRLMAAKGVRYAFVYDAWFPQRPADWIKVAELRLTIPRVSAASDTVALYATDAAAAGKLRDVLQRYRRDNPERKFRIHWY